MRENVIMPQMGESIAEGTLTRWLKKRGERVSRDEPIFEISTDKVDAEIPAPVAGTLAEIKVNEGETVPVNTVVAVIETEAGATVGTGGVEPSPSPPVAETKPVSDAPGAAATRTTRSAPARSPIPASSAFGGGDGRDIPKAAALSGSGASVDDLRRIRSSPLVRRIAREHNIDLAGVRGTGLSGRVTKKDVLAALDSGAAAASSAAIGPTAPVFSAGDSVSIVPMSPMRRKIAEHMMLSRKTSAHVTTVFEVDMSRLMRLRNEHRQPFQERHGLKLTVTPFLVKAAVDGLKAFPVVNASVDGENIVYHRGINIGIAVALDWGLIVPVIRNADDRSLSGIAKTVTDLADRARNRKLAPDEVQGGTFTITNPGVFGSLFGTPIINQPQVAIMGVGAITKRPVVVDDAIGIRPTTYLSLSFDHRLLDGAVADQFMAHIKATIQEGRFPEIV